LIRFINHSCDPNSVAEKWLGRGFTSKILIFAKKDIPAGTEISYNYNFNYHRADFQQECKCGTQSCCKTMGGNNIRNGGVNSISKIVGKNSTSNREKNITSQVTNKNYNHHIVIDTNLNLIIDKKILKGYENKLNLLNEKQIYGNVYSYAEKYFSIIVSDLKNGKSTAHLPNDKSKLPYLTKNAILIRNKFEKILLPKECFISSPKNNNSLNVKLRSNSNKKQIPILIDEKENHLKYSKVSSSVNEFNSKSKKQNFLNSKNISNQCEKLKENHNSRILVNSELIKNIKQGSISNNLDKWKKIKEHFSSVKMNEMLSYSYLILKNEFKNENLAIFYQYQDFNSNQNLKRKIVKKIQMLNDRGSTSNFTDKVQELFTMLINSLKK